MWCGSRCGQYAVCEATSVPSAGWRDAGGTGGLWTHRDEREGAARVDRDFRGGFELCLGADVIVLEAPCAAAGEGGGRSGGARAQFSQAATPVEIGLRDQREARDPVASGLCTIGSPLPSLWPWATGISIQQCTTMHDAFGHKVRSWVWAGCATRLAHASRP